MWEKEINMNKTIKRFLATVLAATMVVGSAMTSRAAQWQQNTTGWWYQEDNGSYPVNTWKWIDGKCYYFDGSGYMLSNTTTPDGYTVDTSGAWVVNGVVQTQGTTAGNNVNYDPAHPLAGMVDAWNLRLVRTNYETGTMGTTNLISNWNVQAMLTNQMDMYRNDLGIDQSIEQILYNWYCNWLNSMDFRNMSEYQRAQEIKKVIEAAEYETGTGVGNEYAVLINRKAKCSDFAMTAQSLSTALGLKCDVKGSANHAWYYIYADGIRYVGNNNGVDLINPVSDEDFHSGSFDPQTDFYNRLNDFYNNN